MKAFFIMECFIVSTGEINKNKLRNKGNIDIGYFLNW